MPSADTYTVGWISALRVEYVAAQVFLDEKHENPDWQATNDNNIYTLGRIGRHNVVIGALPDGEYGISTATALARDMMRTFPNIRVGLMVGIGGGAPSTKHDVRLGDVVVSTPRNGSGGVIQYDYGKTIQSRDFLRTGFLNQPPALLRSAITQIQSKHDIEGHELNESINKILGKNRRLRQKNYGKPNETTDRLFKASFIHAGEKADCDGCLKAPSELVQRPKRQYDEDDPAIHYGNIASANQLMKDAGKRDEIAKQHDVICFEMEAAGLMNQFPCLVIRGICDYADSHKNKEWQGYAAMTAAAYAKELLQFIPPGQVENEKKISELISTAIDLATKTSAKVESIKSRIDRREDIHILNWLTPTDYGLQHSDILSRRHPGSGRWFLDSKEYKIWRNEMRRNLFCPGIPGAGKTVISSIVINDLLERRRKQTDLGIAYIYCDFREKDSQTTDCLVASILKQLSQQQPELPDVVRKLHERHEQQGTRPTSDELWKATKMVVSTFTKVYIVLDAIDELHEHNNSQKGREKFLSKMFDMQRMKKFVVNIFATSRHVPDIVEKFSQSVSLEIRAHERDVFQYVSRELSQIPILNRNPTLRTEVEKAVVESVNGMFLLARLHLESLAGKMTLKTLKLAVRQFKTGSNYDAVYRVAMGRIKAQVPEKTDMAMKVLLWITFAKRRLTPSELQEAIAVEAGHDMIDRDNIADINDLVSACAGLVTVDKASNIIRLVHYTTQEFLEKTKLEWFSDADVIIRNVCLTYISYQEFGTGASKCDHEFEDRLRRNPFYSYASRYFGHHARECVNDLTCLPDFLGKQEYIESLTQALMCTKVSMWHENYSLRYTRKWIGLHMAAYFGWIQGITLCLAGLQGPNARDGDRKSPIMWAAANGHKEAVRLLISTGAVDVDLVDDLQRSVFWFAAEGGHEGVIGVLLNMSSLFLSPTGFLKQASRLQSFGSGYSAKFERTKNVVDLELANACCREALDLLPKNHPKRADWLEDLAFQFKARYRGSKDLGHLGQIIATLQEALYFTPNDNPKQPARLNLLGAGYSDKYHLTEDEADRKMAIQQHEAALHHALSPLIEKLNAGIGLINLYSQTQEWEDAYQAAATTMSLIPPTLPLPTDSWDHQHSTIITLISHFTSDAAALALMAQKPVYNAIQFIEIGRALTARSLHRKCLDMFNLREEETPIEHEYVKLERPSDDAFQNDQDNSWNYLEQGESTHEPPKPAELDRFGLCPTEDELKAAASSGPIVIINISDYRCDALDQLEWLWMAVACPIFYNTKLIKAATDSTWPRVWWIPTGSLWDFPIHAAGFHVGGWKASVLDRVISSYTFSVRTLLHGRQMRSRAKAPSSSQKAVLVCAEKLEFAMKEVDAVEAMCDSLKMKAARLSPSRSDVLKVLNDCQIFHFAGHSGHDFFNILKSHLVLSDEPLTVRDVLEADLQTPFLAYLSSCMTGRAGQNDFIKGSVGEGLHLMSAYQLAGFQNVVGTCSWVDDKCCADVAMKVYERMRGHEFTSELVSEALHLTIRELRGKWISCAPARSNLKRGVAPYSDDDWIDPCFDWAPYMHFGL